MRSPAKDATILLKYDLVKAYNVHFEPDLNLRNLRERLRRLVLHWPRYREGFGMIIGDFNMCEPEEGRFSVRNKSFTEGDAGKTALFRANFPQVLEISQPNFTRKDTAADGTPRTLSRFGRAFINVAMAEARDFHCHSHVTDNLGERSIPSDHVAIRVVIRKPLEFCGAVKRIPNWMSKHHVFCTILKQISDDHQYPDEPFAALADFKMIIEKARKRTRHELLRNTPDSPGDKLLIAATAMRASSNRHLGTLMHCCAAWEPGIASTNAPLNA